MASIPLSELQTFKDVVDAMDASIRAELSATNSSARADIALTYTFNSNGSISIAITTTSRTIATAQKILGTVTVDS